MVRTLGNQNPTKPGPEGQARTKCTKQRCIPQGWVKNKGVFVWPKDLFTLGPSARYLFAIYFMRNMSRLLHVFVSGAQWWFVVVSAAFLQACMVFVRGLWLCLYRYSLFYLLARWRF